MHRREVERCLQCRETANSTDAPSACRRLERCWRSLDCPSKDDWQCWHCYCSSKRRQSDAAAAGADSADGTLGKLAAEKAAGKGAGKLAGTLMVPLDAAALPVWWDAWHCRKAMTWTCCGLYHWSLPFWEQTCSTG